MTRRHVTCAFPPDAETRACSQMSVALPSAGLCSSRWGLSSCLLQSSSNSLCLVSPSVVSSQPAWSPEAWFHDADGVCLLADMLFRWMLGKSLLWILHGAFLSLLRPSGPCSMYDSQCIATVRPEKGKAPKVCNVLIYCVTKSEL